MTTLSGKITKDDGSPALDAAVEVSNSSGDVIDQVKVDSDGAYKYHLAAGTWALKAWDPHGGRGSLDVTLAEGETATGNIKLAPGEGA
jgi:hypothetical protein